MDRHAVTSCQFSHQVVQRQIGLLSYPRFDPVPHNDQLAVTAAMSLRPRLKPACLPFQDHHVVDELHRHPKLRSGCPVRMPFFHESDDALTR